MKKHPVREKIRYVFDYLLSKGPVAMIGLLLAVTMTIVGIIGIVANLCSEDGGVIYHIWNSFLHTLDPGTISGNDASNVPYLVMMTLATLCGLFLTSILIGIITSGVEDKLNDLRKGLSVVQEKNHVVIIGFNDNTFTLLQELVEANANHKNCCIVLLGEQDKEEMEETVAARMPDTKTTHIICRTGSLHEFYSLERCAVENCRSVIVNLQEDAQVIKTILALSAYVKEKEILNPDMYFIASILDKQHLEAARIAGEGRAEIIYAKDTISRIIAHTCRQHGLSQVIAEILNFSGNEMYLERVPEMVGKTFHEAQLSFVNAVPVGLQIGDRVYLNPKMDTVIGEKDLMVLLEMDDGEYALCAPTKVNDRMINNGVYCALREKDHLLILGSNDKLPMILREYSQYVDPASEVVVVDEEMSDDYLAETYGLNITQCQQPVRRNLLQQLVRQGTNILLLNDDSQDGETSDANTLLNLILLRDIAENEQQHFSITTEMRNPENQRLAVRARVDDFVIGSNFIGLLMAQIAENHKMLPLIHELLNEEGCEFYMKSASQYVPLGVDVNGFVLAESAARKGEVYVGYRKLTPTPQPVQVNTDKNEPLVFSENDLIVVIAEE